MGLFDKFKKKPSQSDFHPELYEEAEVDQLERYIERAFGSFEQMFHEIISPDIHVDIAVIAPTDDQPFYKLVTMGMGAHKMNTPPELDEYKLQHAELVVHLPADWKLQSEAEADYWPLRWLKIIARLPGEHNTWVGFGHTIASGEPIANTGFGCMGLITACDKSGESAKLTMDTGKTLQFYQLLPLYPEEMEYKMEKGAIEQLIELFDDSVSTVVQVGRKNFCK